MKKIKEYITEEDNNLLLKGDLEYDTLVIEIIEIISSFLEHANMIREDTELEHLKLDSLTFVKISLEIEKKFNVTMEDEYLCADKFNSVKDIINYIEKLLENKYVEFT